jgi:hypothetical protein
LPGLFYFNNKTRTSIEGNPMSVQAIDHLRDEARNRVEGVEGFDYQAPAELFPGRSKKGRGRVTYKRFDTAAEAIRFAVEEVPPPALLGAYLEVDEARFALHEIHYLYERAAYPLERRAVEPASMMETHGQQPDSLLPQPPGVEVTA